MNTEEVALFINKMVGMEGRHEAMSNWRDLNKSSNTTINSLRILDIRMASILTMAKKGHYARNCWSKKRIIQSNTKIISNRHHDEPEWDDEALFVEAMQVGECSSSEIVEVPSFIATTI